MKMSDNGKILLRLAGFAFAISFCAASFGGQDSFVGIWMAVVSGVALIAACCASLMCLVDTLLENEE